MAGSTALTIPLMVCANKVKLKQNLALWQSHVLLRKCRKTLPRQTLKWWSWRRPERHIDSWPLRFYWWRVLRIPHCHVVSYATSKLKNTVTRCLHMRKKYWIQCSKFTRWSRVDLKHQNQHWAFKWRLLLSRVQTSWWFIIWSEVLQTQLVRLICPLLVMWKWSLPDFRIGITVVSLQAAETKFSDHIRLYMDSRNSLPVVEDERVLEVMDIVGAWGRTVSSLSRLNGALHSSVSWVVKFSSNGSTLYFKILKEAKWDWSVLAMYTCNVTALLPTDMPGMEVQLHIHDML
jgi:hypothetical protein